MEIIRNYSVMLGIHTGNNLKDDSENVTDGKVDLRERADTPSCFNFSSSGEIPLLI